MYLALPLQQSNGGWRKETSRDGPTGNAAKGAVSIAHWCECRPAEAPLNPTIAAGLSRNATFCIRVRVCVS